MNDERTPMGVFRALTGLATTTATVPFKAARLSVKAAAVPIRAVGLPTDPAGLGRVSARAARLPIQAAGVPLRALRSIPPVPSSADVVDLIGERRRRRVWARNGRAYVEVRGLAAKPLRKAVTTALKRVKEVNWVEVNAVTGEVLVAFDEGLTPDRLVDIVSAVERDNGVSDEPLPEHGHPADPGPLAAETMALAADWISFGIAATGRVARLPRLPRGTRVAVALIDTQPRLRRQLEQRLGRYGSDVVIALSNAALHGLTQEPEALAVDGVYRLLLVAELRERRRVWCDREGDMRKGGLPDTPPRKAERPCPLPPGPVESYSDKAALASLAGAGGILAMSADPGAAAEIVLASVPKAAMLGRNAFGAVLSRQLAKQGVIPMREGAFRRLDRITTIVVDSAALCGDGLQILGADSDEAWRLGARLLDADPDLKGSPDDEGRRLVRHNGSVSIERDGEILGKIEVAPQIHPMAEAVLSAAARSGARVILTEHPSTAELLPLVDEALDGSASLAEHVLRLQREGAGVLLVTTDDHDAVAAADVSVGLLDSTCQTSWGADILCGPDPVDLWRLMTAVGAARQASERSVRMALGGSALGALLVTTGRRRVPSPVPLDLAPVHTAALLAMGASALSVLRLVRANRPTPSPRVAWHALDPETAMRRAGELRRALPPERPERKILPERLRPVGCFAAAVGEELRDPLTPVLVFCVAASAVVGSGVDASLVGFVMAGNALISGAQRMRAESSLHRLLLGQRAPARKVGRGRASSVRRLPADELRIGDVIALEPSDVVPADARLIEAEDLEVDESSLTGESQPVAKTLDPVPGAEIAERSCMVFEDTTVLAGRARAVVVATGTATQAGRAAAIAGPARGPVGVQEQLNRLTRIALPATGVGGALVGGLALLRGVPVRQAVAAGVSMAVAAVPEGLPLVATVAQLAAARRLSRRNVLVRTSRTLGAMGRVDTLCFDKTGTLTEGRLKVARLSGLSGDVDRSHPLGERLLTVAARACPQDDPKKLRHSTDRAVVEAARESTGDDTGWELLDEVPFEASRGYAASVGRDGGEVRVCVKGAPEVVLPRCAQVEEDGSVRKLDEKRAYGRIRELAGSGLRVLAVAEARPGDGDVEGLGESADLTLLGFVGIADPPRPEAAAAIERLGEAGIRVVMITGDHPATAQAIAGSLGIAGADAVLTGAELDRLSERERSRRIARTSVFARVSPEHKVRIVQGLQRSGHTVAMTGDGSNDAAAIRLADVGVGMSSGDSRAARSAADLIIPASDLGSIVEALLEGRALWQSVRNAVSILVGGNAGEIAFTLYGTTVGGGAPLSTRQLLLVNTLTDMLPALAVALASPDPDEAESAGHGPMEDPLGDPMWRAIFVRGGVTALGAVLAWQAGRFTGRSRRASTMGLAALVTTQLVQTLQTGRHSRTVIGTCALSVLALAAVIETPGVSQFFGCTPLGPVAWGIVLASAGLSVAAAAMIPRAFPQAVPLFNQAVAKLTPDSAVRT
jgi:cation-transporting ATPase I